jgi:hypothetical protein
MTYYLSEEGKFEGLAGKIVTAADFSEERLRLEFDDGTAVQIRDDVPSCCEIRYMTTDDDVSSLVGHKLLYVEAKDGPTEEDEDGDPHETCFVEVATDDGFITITSHNEHNGWYGGFALLVVPEETPDDH